jgi:hypothetical protein
MEAIASKYEPEPESAEDVTGERGAPRSGEPLGLAVACARKPTLDLTEKDIMGLGRAELVSRLTDAVVDARASRAILSDEQRMMHATMKASADVVGEVWRERDVMKANLDATQARCSELLTALRATKVVERMLANGPSHEPLVWQLLELGAAIGRAREKHPGGSDLTSLLSEAGEVATAMYRETPSRVAEELLDLAVVAMRLRAGEVKVKQIGFHRAKSEGI